MRSSNKPRRYIPKAGDLVWTDFDPRFGREQSGRRPALVVSPRDFCRVTEFAIVCPITSRVRPLGTSVVLPPGLPVSGEILTSHVRSIDTLARPLSYAGATVPAATLDDVRSKLAALIGLQQNPVSEAVEKVEAHIVDAVKNGAKVVLGGKLGGLGREFLRADGIDPCDNRHGHHHGGDFSPVAPLYRFKTDDEAIKMANDTEFGLAAYFYSRDIGRIWRVAEGLEYGIVGINEGIISTEIAPFGGMKESGIGREGSKYGIEEFLEVKYLCMGGIDR